MNRRCEWGVCVCGLPPVDSAIDSGYSPTLVNIKQLQKMDEAIDIQFKVERTT